MKSYVILGVFAIFCVNLANWMADQFDQGYTKADVRALNSLVGKLNEEETVKSTSHFSKGVLYIPKNEQEREELRSYVFGRE